MGCDIHTLGQVKRNGIWVNHKFGVGADRRDYHSFAVLADVRNGYGFEPWPYISEPRGFPDDFEYVESEDLWLGDHSYSWLLMSEILDFVATKLNREFTQIGVLELADYKALRDHGTEPNKWSGGVSGPGIVVVDDIGSIGFSDYYLEEKKATHVHTRWKRKTRDSLHYLNAVIEDLRGIAKEAEVSTDEVRLVFGFDS